MSEEDDAFKELLEDYLEFKNRIALSNTILGLKRKDEKIAKRQAALDKKYAELGYA